MKASTLRRSLRGGWRQLCFVRFRDHTGFIVRAETLDGGFPGFHGGTAGRTIWHIFGTGFLRFGYGLLHGSYITVLQFLNVGFPLGDIRTVPAACEGQKREQGGEEKELPSGRMESCLYFGAFSL